MANRLRAARRLAGYATAADACRQHGWVENTYNQYESGLRGFIRHVPQFARAYRVNREWLQFGSGFPRGNLPALIFQGTIGQFGIVSENEQEMPRGETVSLGEPPGERAEYAVYIVAGDLNYPALFDGDVVYVGEPTDPERVIGRQCIATLGDGTKRICILARGAATGLFMVMSFNATPLQDVRVTDAAPVIWIKRG